jgi:hypothetical protein
VSLRRKRKISMTRKPTGECFRISIASQLSVGIVLLVVVQKVIEVEILSRT